MVLKKLNSMNYKLYNILFGITFRVTENFLKNIISVQQNNPYLEKIQQLTEIISSIPKPLTLQNIREQKLSTLFSKIYMLKDDIFKVATICGTKNIRDMIYLFNNDLIMKILKIINY